jgi:hypothetical protein
VQEIFRDSLRSPELRLRVVKYKHNLEQRRPPAPVFPNKAAPSPADVHGRRAHSEDRDSVNMVEGEEKGACGSGTLGAHADAHSATALAQITSEISMTANPKTHFIYFC